jgi:hypothetical protein
MSVTVRPHRGEVPDEELDDLRERLARARRAERETVDDSSPGIPLAYLGAAGGPPRRAHTVVAMPPSTGMTAPVT